MHNDQRLDLLKAVLFDLEGNLVESAYQKSPEILGRLRKETKEKLLSLGVPRENLSGVVRSSILRNRSYQWADENLAGKEKARLRAEVEAFMRPYDMSSARRTVLYHDTVDALSLLLDRGIVMGIVTNTSAAAADYILTNLGLSRFFRTVVSRSDAPRLKPDPAMIHLAASRLQMDVGWLVGDSAFDAEAAYKAGLRFILIRRDGAHPDFEHDFFIKSLEEVPPIVLRYS